jgi:starch synthase
MEVAFVTAEIEPLSKVGGLGDVAGALPQALAGAGARVAVFSPFYGQIERARFPISRSSVFEREISLGPLGKFPLKVFLAELPGSDVPVFLFHNDHFFQRDGVYTDPATGEEFPDGAYRYIFFVKACLEFLRLARWRTDIVHCQDSHTALLPALLRLDPAGAAALASAGSLLTIHNIAYQGLYPPDILPALELPTDMFYPLSPFEYYGKVNMLKVGCVYADMVTTVSERYAAEIQESNEYGCGLEGILRQRRNDLIGVLNGVDYGAWNPATDRLIDAPYDPSNLEGKRANKRALLQAYQFPATDPARPVIGMVGRLVDQKGFDIVLPLLPKLASKGACLVILGSGLPRYQEQLEQLRKKYPGFLGVRIGYDNRLAHLIEAGSDMFLMPSRFEPCGLNQMYSLKYGTVPVVRATGGLADTVRHFDAATGEGTGFVFADYTPAALWAVLEEALAAYADSASWRKLMRNGMACDFSWSQAARKYMAVYRKVLQRKAAR